MKPWSKQPAKKVISADGNKVYKSRIKAAKAYHDKCKNPVSGYWADFKPRRDFGVFANTRAATYTHNGEIRLQ